MARAPSPAKASSSVKERRFSGLALSEAEWAA